MIYSLNLKTEKKGLIGIYHCFRDCEEAAVNYFRTQNFTYVKVVESQEESGVIKVKATQEPEGFWAQWAKRIGVSIEPFLAHTYYFKVISDY